MDGAWSPLAVIIGRCKAQIEQLPWALVGTDLNLKLMRVAGATVSDQLDKIVRESDRPHPVESGRRAMLCAFDLLEVNGEDIRQEPIEDRKRRLAALLRQPRDGNAHLLKTSKMLHRCYGSEGQIVTLPIQHWINFGHTFSYGRVSKVVRCNSNWQRH
jgi:hypothetical protein